MESEGFLDWPILGKPINIGNVSLEPGAKIYMKLNNCFAKRTCILTGEYFRLDLFIFLINEDWHQPVMPEVARQLGFTITTKDFSELESLVFAGIGAGINKKTPEGSPGL